MDKEFVAKMKDKLLTLKEGILQHLMAEDAEFKDLVEKSGSTDVVDVASEDIDKNVLSALGSQELKRLRLIDAALGRIENGRYGLCLKSGKPIPKERLEAIPYALYRIEVQNEFERRNR